MDASVMGCGVPKGDSSGLGCAGTGAADVLTEVFDLDAILPAEPAGWMLIFELDAFAGAFP